MPKKRESAVPGKVYEEFTIDLPAIKRSVVQRANDAVPAYIKAMNPEQCRAEIRRILAKPGAISGYMREPGEDG